jgi:type II secretory pathway pseudopilin PulG
MKSTRKNTYTMLEILAVIVVIAILLSLLVPLVQKSRNASANAMCVSNLKQCGLTFSQYLTSNRLRFPSRYIPWDGDTSQMTNWALNNGRYTKDAKFQAKDRALNPYLGISDRSGDPKINVAQCRSTGGQDRYDLLGTSYAYNTIFGPGYNFDNLDYITLGQTGQTERLNNVRNSSEMVAMGEWGGFQNANGRPLSLTHSDQPRFNLLTLDGAAKGYLVADKKLRGEGYSFITDTSRKF